MKIMKASAGSGKTYRLSKTYLELLLQGDGYETYRHILAVTFTNKATAEMKSRILRDLKELSATNPKARKLLVNILHDYSAFAVSTIDRFFQQTLKAFSREIGQFADYQIELDRKSLIAEAMDRILDSLSEDRQELLDWIKKSIVGNMELGKKVKVDEGLYEMGLLLKSEEHRELSERHGIDDGKDYAPERLSRISEACRTIIEDFRRGVCERGLEFAPGEKVDFEGKKKILKSKPELMEFVEDNIRQYNTAYTIDKLIYSLGLAGEFYKEFDALLKEKNLMCLDESNTILRDIINGSDAPFVYEKLGVRYEHFLLDEFQDTSNIQWENFYPLLRESESKGGSNLIVGDVKQSIYRFRDSDWKLLGEKVKETFPSAEEEVLDGNWRSSETVVHFNNAFFKMAASKLGLSEIYSDVRQEVRKKDDQKGYVRVSFCNDQMAMVRESIANALEAGARYGDVAILVRNKKEGAQIAEKLIADGLPVISDDSLNLKSSVVVRRLLALLSSFDNPDDKISLYFAAMLGFSFPESYHSLIDFCESLLRELEAYDAASFDAESLFIQAFMDELQTWTASNGNNLRMFLRHWAESEFFIGSPENAESIRVLTIHKSKGLEFPYVIFPYAETVTLYKAGTHWCHLDAKAGALPEVFSGIYPVALGKAAAQSHFDSHLEEERARQLVDNINLFYVALTRAGKCLHIISKEPTKTFKESLKKNNPVYMTVPNLLYEFVGANEDMIYGSMYDFGRMERAESGRQSDFESHYHSIPLGGRLMPSEDAADFFGGDGNVGAAASARLRGVVLHGILSAVVSPADLQSAVQTEMMEGTLSEDEAAAAFEMLGSRIGRHPEWFPESAEGVVVLNEQAIFDAFGQERRPDRVVVEGDSVRIVDFKFGKEDEKYVRQLQRYASLYRQLGYRVLSADIWYVEEGKTVNVEYE